MRRQQALTRRLNLYYKRLVLPAEEIFSVCRHTHTHTHQNTPTLTLTQAHIVQDNNAILSKHETAQMELGRMQVAMGWSWGW